MSSRRWCKCSRSAENGDFPARRRLNTASEKSSSGMTRIASGNRIGMKAGSNCLDEVSVTGSTEPVTEIAEAAIIRPTSRAPESPMKILAGCQLSGRKPTHAPMSTAVISEARLKYSDSPIPLVRM